MVVLIIQEHLRWRGVKRIKVSGYTKHLFTVKFLQSDEWPSLQDLMQQTVIVPQTWVLRDQENTHKR